MMQLYYLVYGIAALIFVPIILFTVTRRLVDHVRRRFAKTKPSPRRPRILPTKAWTKPERTVGRHWKN